MLTLDQFRATRQWSDDLSEIYDDEQHVGISGYHLEDRYCLEYRPDHGDYIMWIGRCDHVSTCIDELVKLAYIDYVNKCE